jgi:hypothetical protein
VTKHSEIAMLANLDAEMTTGRGDGHRLADLAPIGTRNHIAADICVAAGGASHVPGHQHRHGRCLRLLGGRAARRCRAAEARAQP